MVDKLCCSRRHWQRGPVSHGSVLSTNGWLYWRDEFDTWVEFDIDIDVFWNRSVSTFQRNLLPPLIYGEVLGDKSTMHISVPLYWGYWIVLWLFHLVCILCCGCFNWFCNVLVCVWVCVCVCGCFGNMCTCIVCNVSLYCFVYVYLFLFVFSVQV